MISFLLDFAKAIFEQLRNENELRLEQRLRVSGILEEISNILRDTAEKLERDEYPHYNCVLMENMSNQLHFNLLESVQVDSLDLLHSQLVECSQVEKQFALRKEPETIPQLYKAAAEFKTFSMFMKF